MRRLNAFLRRLRRDRRGVTAVEFAFLAPVVILMYFGLAEYTQAMMAERKAIRTASAIGDLIAQVETITPTGTGGIDDVFAISSTIMSPFPTTSSVLKLCTASLTANANATVVTVDWSRNSGDTTCPVKASTYVGTPADLIAGGQSLIMARVKYEYASPVKYLLKTNPTFTKLYYLRPRKSSKVLCPSC